MNNLEKYNKAFKETFLVEESNLNDQFTNQNVDNWDSVHQLSLVTSLEEIFDIMFETEDILGLFSYKQGKEILAKYDVIV